MLYHSCRGFGIWNVVLPQSSGTLNCSCEALLGLSITERKIKWLVLGNWIRIACSILHLWSLKSCFPALLSSGFPPLVWLFSIYQRGTQPQCNTCKCNSASDCGWDGGPWNFWIAWSVMSKTTKYKCSWLDAEKTNFDLKHLYQAKSWATRMYTKW